MANEKTAGNQQTQNGGGSKKKLILIIAILAVVAIGAGIGVTWFLLSGDDDSQQGASEQSKDQTPPAYYVDLEESFIVTYDVGGKQRFMQVAIVLLSRDAKVGEGIKLHMPVVRNKLLNTLGNQPFEGLMTHEGRVAMQEAAKLAVNEVLVNNGIDGQIEQVLYSNMVLQ